MRRSKRSQFIVKHGKEIIAYRPLLYLAKALDAESYLKLMKCLPDQYGMYSISLENNQLAIRQIDDYEPEPDVDPIKRKKARNYVFKKP